MKLHALREEIQNGFFDSDPAEDVDDMFEPIWSEGLRQLEEREERRKVKLQPLREKFKRKLTLGRPKRWT